MDTFSSISMMNLRIFVFLYCFCFLSSLSAADNQIADEKPLALYTHIYKSPVSGSYNEVFFLNQAFEENKLSTEVTIAATFCISAADYTKLTQLSKNRPSQSRDSAIAAIPSCKKIIEAFQRKDLPQHYAIRLELPTKQSTVIYVQSSTGVWNYIEIPLKSYDIFQPSNTLPTPIINLIKVIAAPEPSDFKKIVSHPASVMIGICGILYGIKLLLDYHDKKKGLKP